MTVPTRQHSRFDELTSVACAAAPALLVAYGIARLIDGVDGSYGPGPAWTIGHLCFLAGLILFAIVLFGLRRRVGRHRIIATAAVTAGIVGLIAFIRGILIDLIVGFQGVDRAAMDRIYPRYDRWPGQLPAGFMRVFDNIVPALFILGLVVLTAQLAVARRLPWWSPVLVVVGFALISANLDLLAAGGAALLLALYPIARRARVAVPSSEPTPSLAR